MKYLSFRVAFVTRERERDFAIKFMRVKISAGDEKLFLSSRPGFIVINLDCSQ